MINPIAYSYWRRIKAGAREYKNVPETVKEDVKTIALEELEEGKITQDDYDSLIVED